MKRSTGRTLISLFVILVTIFCAGTAPAAEGGNGKARIARDLAQQARMSPDDRLIIVVTLRPDASIETISETVERLGGRVKLGLKHVRQAVLEVPAAAVEALADVPGLDYVAPDRPVQALASHLQTTTGADQVVPYRFGESLSSFLISGALVGYDGSGVGVAVIDSGIDGEHFDLRTNGKRTLAATVDFAGSGSSDDPYGHGTHIAGIIAGTGYASKQVGSDYSGIAPGASLLNLRVLDSYGRGYVSNVVAAIDYAIANRNAWNVRVINLSIAAPPVDSYRDDPLCQAVERATKAGLVVIAAAGNFGMDPYGNKLYGGITSPGNSPAAVTVGASDTKGTNSRADDTVAFFSSRGATRSRALNAETGEAVVDNLAKPDLVAPGHKVVSLERDGNLIVKYFPSLHVGLRNDSNNKSRYMVLSGTSMSTGVVSGAAALILQANPSLTPNMVKAILMYSAEIMNGADLFEQGAGQINVEGALRLARAMRKDAGTLQAGASLVGWNGLPQPRSYIAGQTVAWSQGLIWGFGWLTGSSLMSRQQEAYAQGLIWGGSGLLSWLFGVSYFDDMHSDAHVVYGQNGQWSGAVWDQGTTQSTGLIWRDTLSVTGVSWQASLMPEIFYDIETCGLIWGYYAGERLGFDVGLIWGGFGYSYDRYAYDVGLIWGITSLLGSLGWGY